MAVTAYFGSTSKRTNSTLVPTLTVSETVVFKQPCSLERPVLYLSAASCDYNYMSMLGRYYWIVDVVSIHDQLWEITAEVDALATLRTEILASPAYVDYAAVGYDKYLPDTRLPVRNAPTAMSYTDFTAFRPINPFYILTAVGVSGSIASYALTGTQFSQLLNNISTYQQAYMPDLPTQPTEIEAIRTLANAISAAYRQMVSYGSAIDCIKSCIYVPFEPVMTDVSYQIYLGEYATGVYAPQIVRNMPLVVDAAFSYNLADDFTDYDPYTRFSVYIPFIGVVQVPNSKVIAAGGSMGLRTSYAPETGQLACQLSAGAHIINTFSSSVAAQIAIGAAVTDPIGVISNAARSILGDYSAIPALARSLLDIKTDSTGSISSFAAIGLLASGRAMTEKHTPHGLDVVTTAVQGRPVGQTGLLSLHEGGYVQTRGMHIIGSTQDRQITEEAEAALDSGVYLE